MMEFYDIDKVQINVAFKPVFLAEWFALFWIIPKHSHNFPNLVSPKNLVLNQLL